MGKSGFILVAEDDYINYLLLEELLVKNGYKVLHANHGKEVIEMIHDRTDVHVVLMDIKMPYMNGYETLKHIRQSHPEMIVIAQTAYALPEDFTKIEEAGFNYYLTKPLDSNKLLNILKNYL